MTAYAAYTAFIAKIDNSVALVDRQFGTLAAHIDCSAMANAEGEGEEMYASALETAQMILDCWADYYPKLVIQAKGGR